MMSRIFAVSPLLVLIALSLAGPVLADPPSVSNDAAAVEFFESQVRPVLVRRCHSCHGPKKQESGLRLDSRRALLLGGDSGDVVQVGKPDESPLVDAIRYGGDIEMPPKEKLADVEIAALVKWVEMGLPWPESKNPSPADALTGDALYRFAREQLWSLQPIQRPALPGVKDTRWAAGGIDFFVLARLEAAQLSPSGQASRRTLIRRATFDLLGVPPTPDEVDAFVSDTSAGAFERLVERLLASPRYGERWGRHWLDVARYADTRGYSFGRERRFAYAYTYRDYVIRAWNADLPYDQFLREQLAADHLDGDPRQLAGLGFLTVGRKFNNRHDDIDDQIDVVTRGLLGLTVACARCHDHKYDAIPTEDYYSLYGVFASSEPPRELPLIGNPDETPGYDQFKAELDKRRKALDDFAARKQAEVVDQARRSVADYLLRVVTAKPESLLAKLPFISLNADDLKPKLIILWRQFLQRTPRDDAALGPLVVLSKLPDKQFAAQGAVQIERWKKLPAGKINARVLEVLSQQPPQSKIDLAKLYGELLSGVYAQWKDAGGNEQAKQQLSPPDQQLLDVLLAAGTPTDIAPGEIRDYLVRADRNHYRELQKNIDTHQAHAPGAPARAMSLVDSPQPVEPQVFIRGQHTRRGDRVPRRFVRLVAGDDRQPFRHGSGRLELADAIASETNPLTARVIVNRVWKHHFGKALVATPSDFGMRSNPPSHPLLLDYLAAGLMQHGWSLKWLHRQIMLSSAYRQTSQDRPDCREKDPENRLLWRMNRRRLEFEPMRDALLAAGGKLETTMYGGPVDIFKQPFQGRRSVYAFIDRQELPGVLRVFDLASPDQSSDGRPQTTVPQQALFLMNSPFVIEQAKGIVARGEVAGQAEAARRIDALYQLLFARQPTAAETATGQEYVSAAAANASPADKLTPWEQYAQLLMLTNEFMFID